MKNNIMNRNILTNCLNNDNYSTMCHANCSSFYHHMTVTSTICILNTGLHIDVKQLFVDYYCTAEGHIENISCLIKFLYFYFFMFYIFINLQNSSVLPYTIDIYMSNYVHIYLHINTYLCT